MRLMLSNHASYVKSNVALISKLYSGRQRSVCLLMQTGLGLTVGMFGGTISHVSGIEVNMVHNSKFGLHETLISLHGVAGCLASHT